MRPDKNPTYNKNVIRREEEERILEEKRKRDQEEAAKKQVIYIHCSVVENSYSGVLRSVLRSGESAFFYSGEGDRSGELKGPGECLRSTPGILRHNIVFSCKITVF